MKKILSFFKSILFLLLMVQVAHPMDPPQPEDGPSGSLKRKYEDDGKEPPDKRIALEEPPFPLENFLSFYGINSEFIRFHLGSDGRKTLSQVSRQFLVTINEHTVTCKIRPDISPSNLDLINYYYLSRKYPSTFESLKESFNLDGSLDKLRPVDASLLGKSCRLFHEGRLSQEQYDANFKHWKTIRLKIAETKPQNTFDAMSLPKELRQASSFAVDLLIMEFAREVEHVSNIKIPHRHFFNLRLISPFDSPIVSEFLLALPNLRELSFKQNCNLELPIRLRCPKLEQLTSLTSLEIQGYRPRDIHLLKFPPNLYKLSITPDSPSEWGESGNHYFRNESLRHYLENMEFIGKEFATLTNLGKLKLGNSMSFAKTFASSLTSLPKLVSLKLHLDQYSKVSSDDLGKLTGLTDLKLSYSCTDDNPSLKEGLSVLTNLTKLSIGGGGTGGEDDYEDPVFFEILGVLCNLVNLTHLTIENDYTLNFNLTPLFSLTNLQTLCLTSWKFPFPRPTLTVDSFANLTKITLSDCSNEENCSNERYFAKLFPKAQIEDN